MNLRSIAAVLLPLAAAACGGSRAPATTTAPAARGQYTTQVEGYLARLATNARGQGYNRNVAGPVYGSLNDDATSSHDLTVTAGNQYVIFGACDNDCTDVDLKIYDTNNNLQLQDVAVDDTPVLTFTANTSGKYRVVVAMATCNRNPCYYGVQLMAR
jgi:hypothetical protein